MNIVKVLRSSTLFVIFLSCYLRAKTQVIVKLDPSTSVTGVEFDVPLQLQFSSQKKLYPVNISLFTVDKAVYKKRLVAITGGKDTSMKDKGYYNELQKRPPVSIPLAIADSFREAKDPAGTYLLKLSAPVYLQPNKHYEIALATSIMDDDRYAQDLKEIINTFLNAHKKLGLPSGQKYSAEERPLLDIVLPMNNYDDATRDRLETEWQQLKAAYSSNADANIDFRKAIEDYGKLHAKFLKGNFNIATVPEKDVDVPGPRLWFYQVYQSIQPLIDIFSSYDSTTAAFNPSFPTLVMDSCLYAFLSGQLDCIGCKGNLPAAFLKDTSGLFAFVNTLLQNNNEIADFIAKQITAVKNSSISTLFDKKSDKKLQQILDRLLQIKIMTDYAVTNSLDKCKRELASKIDAACIAVKAIIDTKAALFKWQLRYDELLRKDESYFVVNYYNLDTYVYKLDTRYGLRLTSDIGVIDYGLIPGYAYNPGQITPYFGIQLNFRYTKSDLPFSSIPGNTPWSLRRFSAFLGITAFSVKQSPKFDNLFGKHGLLLGLGYRFIPEIRMVVGSMLAKKNNPNPLITSTTTIGIPFIGISFDTNKILEAIVSKL